ncbi:NHPM BACTERIOCIN SYSTEM ABC TRANSPORTER PEPTIDASE/ATP-BINDING PROTEIN-RELATED [Salix viminalis]|uniref:ABC-type xenobiotic transporter n=1 Tax=Salix viminalis TaxID=40686 RepID=A0A9Q0QCY7_SALVM|nr:NHPM BACTERIOCIN SYSTEM ABC TRANSPORTER PEPTIDASE/ATP-BINDING PROTEIN-RELATED [Salix viminalis]
MALSECSLGEFSRIYEGKLDFGSSCTQRIIVDVINLLFLGVFYLSLIVGSITKSYQVSGSNRRDWISVGVSFFCVLVSIAYISAGLWDLIAGKDIFDGFIWLVYLARGLIWISLAVSLLLRESKWIRVLVRIWWASFSLLISALNIEILARERSIQILDVFPWPVNFLLLFCAFRNLNHFACLQTSDKSLSEPLIGGKDVKNRSKLYRASFLSRLTFSWISPLLGLGYLKPLDLEDIPSLVPEDEANEAYQKFAFAWDSLVREKGASSAKNMGSSGCGKSLSIVGGLILVKVVESLSQRHCFFYSRKSGMRIRSALMVAIYQKATQALQFRKEKALGRVLFGVVGLGALTGLVPLLVCGLLNVPFARMLQKCQAEFMISQDERLRATSEILNSMKIIKLQSWEENFKNLMESHRGKEFKWLKEMQFKKAYGMGEPVRMIPEALSVMIQVKVSFDRINNFLLDDELKDDNIKKTQRILIKGRKLQFVGPVGAGKSSLLYAILGEIPKLSEIVGVMGSIAYVSQTSWIQSGTVRDNILYGKPMDQAKYEKAIRACALDKDINSFRAVDAHTASILFNDCVMTALEKKTVILVTHQLEFLAAVDRILVMESRKITQSGSYEELLIAGTAFEQLINAHKDSITVSGPVNNGNQGESLKGDMVQSDESKLPRPGKDSIEGEISVKSVPGVQLTEEEEKENGDVGWKPFLDYLSVSKGTPLLCLSILSQCGFVAFQAAATYWLAFAIQIPDISSGFLIGIYTLISTLSAVFVYGRSLSTAYLGLKASKSFFSGFTEAIFKAPMLFFDSTPVGRILTRASSDLSVLDFDIPFAFIFVAAPLTELLATLGIMASVTWQVLIAAFLAMAASKYVQGYYLASARELIRMNGTTKAPVMNYAAETSLGVVTIRAFKMADRFFQNFLQLVDNDAVLFFHSNGAMEWLVIRTEAIQNTTLFTAALLLILLPKGSVPPGLVGLSLSYALSLTGTQVFMTRWYCNLANYIISAERIKQFMNIPPEPPAVVEDKRPPSSWPFNGRIEFQELKLRYRPNAPLVLERNQLHVQGRSESGSSGEDGKWKNYTDKCFVSDLRMKLSIIPQEPTLFRGSIRTNIDPLGLHSDQEIWEALDKCQLKATISNLPHQLDSSVSDEGENWSGGQRQLFCLGRVLLKRNRILVLDEATASIDSATDAILQRIIRQEFSDCTVITVAHRVPTVIDSDMVMVLSYGKLVEYDEPTKLMETNSSFSKLVAEYWSSCRQHTNRNFENNQS